MIEKVVLDYLNRILTVPAYMEEPEEPPQSYVVLEKTRGDMENFILSSMVAIQSYGESLQQAAELNEEIKKAMEGLIELNEICNVQLNSDYNYTDTTKKKYRYQAVYDLTHY